MRRVVKSVKLVSSEHTTFGKLNTFNYIFEGDNELYSARHKSDTGFKAGSVVSFEYKFTNKIGIKAGSVSKYKEDVATNASSTSVDYSTLIQARSAAMIAASCMGGNTVGKVTLDAERALKWILFKDNANE